MRRLFISSSEFAGYRAALIKKCRKEAYFAETLEEARAHLGFVDEVVFWENSKMFLE
jgi:hypothetical protein